LSKHKFLLTPKQLTPYNELPFHKKVMIANDLEKLASRTHQVIPRTLLFHDSASYSHKQMLLLEGNKDSKEYLNRFYFWR
jgi:hypothetical protein